VRLIRELNRRNVVRVGAAYFAVAWLAVQVAQTVLPLYGFGVGAVRTLIAVLAVGIVPTLIFAWVFEITPAGVKLERDVVRDHSITDVTGQKLDRLIIVVLAIALTFFIVDRFVIEPDRNQAAIDSAFKEGQSRALLDSFGDRSIAVLPFTNMSGDNAQEYFSDGISEELLNLLAKVPQLRVISRASAFAFKGQSIGIPEIARQLRVVHVLEGSVRQAGNKVRITAQLIDARTDAHVWSVTYDRTMDDIFAIQDEIAAQVVSRLKVTLLGDAPHSRVTNPQAYTLYLQAKRTKEQASKESYQSAIELLQQALSIDPQFADAWLALAGVYIAETSVGLRPFIEGYGLAEDAIERASKVDATNATIPCAWSDIRLLRDFDLAAAADLVRAGLASDPGNEFCIKRLGFLRSSAGQPDKAIEVSTYLNDRDPVTRPADIAQVIDLWSANRLDDAISAIAEARAHGKSQAASISALEGLVRVFRGAPGDLDAALSAVQAESVEGWRLQGMAVVQYARGDHGASDAALEQFIAKYAQSWPYNIAAVYAYRGDADRAFEWLERAFELRDSGIVSLGADPQFRTLHRDSRWLPLLTKLGQSPEQLARVDLDAELPRF
jgi:adenylate cyclase